MANDDEKGRILADPSVGAVPAAPPGTLPPSDSVVSGPVAPREIENQPLLPEKEAARLLNPSSVKPPKVSPIFLLFPGRNASGWSRVRSRYSSA